MSLSDEEWCRLLEAAEAAEDDVVAAPTVVAVSAPVPQEVTTIADASSSPGAQDGEDPMPLVRSHIGKIRVWCHRIGPELLVRFLALWLIPGSGAFALCIAPFGRLKDVTAWWLVPIAYGALTVFLGFILWTVTLFDESLSMRDERDRRLFEENTEIAVAINRWLGEYHRNVERIATARAIRRIALEIRQKRLEEGIRYHQQLLPSSRQSRDAAQTIAEWDARDNPRKPPKRSATFTAR